jgi:hypothetical protein
VSNVLDGLRAFTEEKVEVLSEPDKEARNLNIIADVSYTKARGKAEVFNTTGGSVELKLFRIERVRLNQSLKGRTQTQEDREALLAQWQKIDDEIESLIQEQKRLKTDALAKRKAFMEASKVLKELQAKKNTKLDKPTIATVENILLKYEISPARYHGGKLNGNDCRELMYKSAPIFEETEQLFLSIEHPQRCSSHTIMQWCKVYSDTLVTLDLISSEIRVKQGKLKDNNLSMLRRAIGNLSYLWEQAGLSFLPKIHGVLAHAADQVELFRGIGDML